jgi:hypothetical protein
MYSSCYTRGMLLLTGLLIALTLFGSQRPAAATAQHHDEPQPTPTTPPDYRIIEGDIMVLIDGAPADLSRPEATWRQTHLWAGGRVPYQFDANVTATNQQDMQEAMDKWQAVANIRFEQCANNTCPNDSDHLYILASDSNSSFVGNDPDLKRQEVHIAAWDSEGVILHELGHALGYWHEQSHPKRDDFVEIKWENVSQTACTDNNNNPASCNSQFKHKTDAGQYGPYDFDSVMHYSQCAFSIFDDTPGCPSHPTAPFGGRTIVVRPPHQESQSKIGQRTHLSYLDKVTMGVLYPRQEWRFLGSNWPAAAPELNRQAFLNLVDAYGATPDSGTLWIQPGRYSGRAVYDRPMTIAAPLGSVLLER